MPLPPARRREVRASRRDEPVFEKKRCLNCPKFFPLTKPHRKFCSIPCKDQFNKFGGAYGKLKEKLFAEIEAQVRAVRKTVFAEISDQSRRIDRLESIIEGSTDFRPVPADGASRETNASLHREAKRK